MTDAQVNRAAAIERAFGSAHVSGREDYRGAVRLQASDTSGARTWLVADDGTILISTRPTSPDDLLDF